MNVVRKFAGLFLNVCFPPHPQTMLIYVISSLFPIINSNVLRTETYIYAKCWKTQIHFVSVYFLRCGKCRDAFLHSLFTFLYLKYFLMIAYRVKNVYDEIE